MCVVADGGVGGDCMKTGKRIGGFVACTRDDSIAGGPKTSVVPLKDDGIEMRRPIVSLRGRELLSRA